MSLGYKILGVVLACVAMFFVGRCSVGRQEITTIERVDTVIVEKPMPYKVEVVRKVSVPVYVPTPADTVVVARVDSVLVEVPVEVERREYKDSLYRAVISGAKIGDLRPTLESMEVYSRSEVQVVEQRMQVVEQKVPWIRPYVSASGGRGLFGVGGGISIKQKVDVGAMYLRVDNKDKWAIMASYRW